MSAVQLKLRYCLRHPIRSAKSIFGVWPSDIPIKRVLSEIPSNATVVEAGMGEGYHTKLFSESLPDGKIFALEPITPLFQLAQQRCRGFKNVNLFNLALVEAGNSHAKLYTSNNGSHESSSILRPAQQFNSFYPNVIFDTIKEVPGVTLDDFCRENQISVIDLLWLDLQGSEMMILKRGGLGTLRNTRFLHVEVMKLALYTDTILVDELLDFMKEMEFEVLEKRMGIAAGNVLLRNKRF